MYGIYYTIFDEYVYVGKPGGDKTNAVQDKALTSLTFPKTIQNKPVTGIFQYAFFDYKGVTLITIPDTVKIIENNAFDLMYFDFEILTLPPNIEYIGQRAFAANSFKSVYIPATVSYIGSSAFGSNDKLETIEVDPNNNHYIITENKCYIDYMKTVLVQAPQQMESLTFEPSLVQIGYAAILGGKMKELIFPVTFAKIAKYSFQTCQNLETIYFLGNLITVEDSAFYQCDKLTNIYYYGTNFINVNLFSTNINPTIRVCSDYKKDSFATFTNIIKQGVCAPINYIIYLTPKSNSFNRCCYSSLTYIFIYSEVTH